MLDGDCWVKEKEVGRPTCVKKKSRRKIRRKRHRGKGTGSWSRKVFEPFNTWGISWLWWHIRRNKQRRGKERRGGGSTAAEKDWLTFQITTPWCTFIRSHMGNPTLIFPQFPRGWYIKSTASCKLGVGMYQRTFKTMLPFLHFTFSTKTNKGIHFCTALLKKYHTGQQVLFLNFGCKIMLMLIFWKPFEFSL